MRHSEMGDFMLPDLEINPEMSRNMRFAFSPDKRIMIGERDNWTCQCCGRSKHEGYRVDAAHIDHDRSKSTYNDIDTGLIICVLDHCKDHIELMLEEQTESSMWALKLISQRIWDKGLTYGPESIIHDREELLALYESYNLDPRQFIANPQFES